MQSLSYPTETVLSNQIIGNRVVLSFKDSPRRPSRTRAIPNDGADKSLPFFHLTKESCELDASTDLGLCGKDDTKALALCSELGRTGPVSFQEM